MKRTIVMRTQGGAEVGLGHLRRSLVMAKALREFGNCHCVFLLKGDKSLGNWVTKNGFSSSWLSPELPFNEELKGIEKLLNAKGSSLLWIDSYEFNASQLERLRSLGTPLALMEDTPRLPHYPVDLLMSYHLYAESAGFRTGNFTQCLFGALYAPIDPNLQRVYRPRRNRTLLKTIGLTLGGSEVTKTLLKIGRCLATLGEEIEVRMILGPSSKVGSELKQFLERHGNFNLICNPPRFSQAVGNTDLCVSSAGVTAYELAYLGVPSLLITLSDNQRLIAESFGKAGIALSGGDVKSFSNAAFLQQLDRLRRNAKLRTKLSEKARRIIDGKGAERLARAVLNSVTWN